MARKRKEPITPPKADQKQQTPEPAQPATVARRQRRRVNVRDIKEV